MTLTAQAALDLLDAHTRWRFSRTGASAAMACYPRLIVHRRQDEPLSAMVIRLAERVSTRIHIDFWPGAAQDSVAAGEDVTEPALGQVASQRCLVTKQQWQLDAEADAATLCRYVLPGPRNQRAFALSDSENYGRIALEAVAIQAEGSAAHYALHAARCAFIAVPGLRGPE